MRSWVISSTSLGLGFLSSNSNDAICVGCWGVLSRSSPRNEGPVPSLLEVLSAARPQLSDSLAAAPALRGATSPKDAPPSQGSCVPHPMGEALKGYPGFRLPVGLTEDFVQTVSAQLLSLPIPASFLSLPQVLILKPPLKLPVCWSASRGLLPEDSDLWQSP